MSSIYRKLVACFLILNLFAMGSIGVYSYYKEKEALLSRTFDQLISLRLEKKNRITGFFRQRIRDMENISNIPAIQTVLHHLASKKPGQPDVNQIKTFPNNDFEYLVYLLKNSGCYTRFCFVDKSGNAFEINLADSVPKVAAFDLQRAKTFQNAFEMHSNGDKAFIKEVLVLPDSQRKVLFAGKSLFDENNRFSGIIVAGISPSAINKIMFENNPNNGLSKTGEVYLVGDDSLMRSNSRFLKNSVFKTKVNTKGVQNALKGKTAYSQLNDYRNIPVLSAYSPLDFSLIHWAVLAEIDVKEAMIPIYSIRDNIIYLSLLIALLSAAVITFLSGKFTEPLKKLQAETTKIALGKYGNTVKVKTKDEIGQLTESFNKMSLRIKAQAVKLENEKKLRVQSIIDAQEKERQRLSRELHDGLGPLLLTGKMKLEETLNPESKNIKKTVTEVMALFSKTIQEIRNISGDMMPSGLKEFGLTVALQNFCRQIMENHPIQINCLLDLQKQHYGKTIDIYIFRIVQEAVNNTLKYAKATEINLSFEEIDNHLFLTIRDNGCGFDQADKSFSLGNGIINMKERVNLLNGYFELTTTVGKGTGINIDIPLL